METDGRGACGAILLLVSMRNFEVKEGKIKSWYGRTAEMVKGPLKIVVYVVAAILLFLGVVFIISTNLGIIYFFEGLTFLAVGILLLIFTREKKPLEIKQTVAVTGPIKVKEVRCPVCNAVIDPTKVEVVDGKPYVTCNYCNNKFELTEEPTW